MKLAWEWLKFQCLRLRNWCRGPYVPSHTINYGDDKKMLVIGYHQPPEIVRHFMNAWEDYVMPDWKYWITTAIAVASLIIALLK